MLEAVHKDLVFTISLKRSTQNLQLSTSSPADYPIFGSKAAAAHSKRGVRFTPKAAADVTDPRVRFGPTADSCTAANEHLYSISSSAMASNVGGMARPPGTRLLGASSPAALAQRAATAPLHHQQVR
jgi:hypothetical protein